MASSSDSKLQTDLFEVQVNVVKVIAVVIVHQIHSKPFRRLKDKTQVFLSPQGDHYRTRMMHTLEVSQTARTVARCLRLLHPETDPDHLTLSKAKRLYPEWYHERIELGLPVRPVREWKWRTSRAVYDAWLRRIREEAVVGHRYHCIMALAIYALKCDVPYDELKRDAYGLYDAFEGRTNSEDNHFLRSDIAQALRVYRQPGYVTFPNASISYFSGLRIEPNRRNGRDQKTHLRRARAVQLVDDPDGAWRNSSGRPKGSPNKSHPKRDAVLAYRAEHPEATQRQIAEALGVSKTTVNKWLKAD